MRKDVFQAIADPTRRAILQLLLWQTMTPNAIAAHFDTSRQAVSKHIRILAESNLVKEKREGREIHYRADPAKLKAIDKWLEPFRQQWDTRFRQLDEVLHHLKNK